MGALSKAMATTLAPILPGLRGGTFWPMDGGGTTTLDSTPTGVTPSTSLNVMAYLAGIRVLAEGVASLPLFVYQRLEGGGKQRATSHPLYPILHDQANPEMTSFIWRETAMGHVVAWGNSYSERETSVRGLKALWPLRPDRMQVMWNAERRRKVYRYRLPDGSTVDLPPERVLHIRGLSPDGLVGYAPLSLMAKTLGLSLSAAEFSKRTFDNNARPGVVLTHPKTLSDTARSNLEKSWKENHEGLSNAQRTAILEEGVTVTEVGFPPEQTQLLEMRTFEVREIARGLNIRPHKIGDLADATYSNIEQQAIDHVVSDLRPWLVRWESQINMDLVGDPRFFVEFLVDGLLRGDAESRSRALAVQRQNGVLTGDEWREIENRNPLPDGTGSETWMPLNYTVDPGVKGVPGGQPGQQANPGALAETNGTHPGPEHIVTRAQVLAAQERLRADGQYAGYDSLARELNVSRETIRRRLNAA
jgi:HK97 family phage portal protein